MDVSVIIVNFNTINLLRDCLTSVFTMTQDVSFEVFVSDNGSTDGSIAMIRDEFPSVCIINNGHNIGFGAANNAALKLACGKYIFYLNSDTILKNNAIKIFYDYYKVHEDERIGALGCMLTGKDGCFIHSAGTFPGFHLSIKQLAVMLAQNFILSLMYIFRIDASFLLKLRRGQCVEPFYGDVDFVTGADLFVRNNESARFDERYFLYFEDSTMQLAMKQKGLSRRIIEGPSIIHLCGASAGKDFSVMRKASFSRIQFEFSRIRFLGDRYGRHSPFVCMAKVFVFLLWCNPILFKKTMRSIPEMLSL